MNIPLSRRIAMLFKSLLTTLLLLMPFTAGSQATDSLQEPTPARSAERQDSSPLGRATDKKRRFAEWLLPFIIEENRQLLEQRQTLWRLVRYLNAGYRLELDAALWLERLAREYRVKRNPIRDPEARLELLKRVDAIPPSLALAQAAIESAWGQSRFTQIANNLFGIWTFDPSRGVLPRARETGKRHYIRKFENVGASLRYYLHLLNTQPAYRKLRELRYRQRLKGETLSGWLLAEGLDRYSAKGQEYVRLVRSMIRQNGWEKWDYF